jgi:hypothetical protein
MFFFHIFHACHMTRQALPISFSLTWVSYWNWWIVEIMKLLFMQLSRPPATSSILGLPLNYWYKLVSSICPRNNSLRRTESLTFYPGAGLVLLLVPFYRSIAAALSHSFSLKGTVGVWLMKLCRMICVIIRRIRQGFTLGKIRSYF